MSGPREWSADAAPPCLRRSSPPRRCTLARLGKRYSPALSSERALSASTPPMKTRRCSSITPSRLSRSAMSIMPERGGMVTTLSSCKGPGASNRLLPMTAAPPPRMRTRTSKVKIALPTITSGLRARRERTGRQRHVIGLQSGARTARRDAFGLHERRGKSIRPAGYRRLRLARAEHHPCRRCCLSRARRRHRGAKGGRNHRDLTRPLRVRHRQFSCYRRRRTPRDRTTRAALHRRRGR